MSSLTDLLLAHSSKLTEASLPVAKRTWSKTLGYIPRDSDVLTAYRTLIDQGLIVKDPQFLSCLTTRAVRSLSGVTPFAVMTKPYPCPGQCTYCPLELGMPKSYLSDEPAAARARSLGFDPKEQILSRLTQLTLTGHDVGKIELIVIGGTFSNYPESYKREFFKNMIDAVNGFPSPTLAAAQIANETALRRIVGISIETRPDWVDAKEVKLLRELGVTKLQLGVQAFDEQILVNIKRGHSLEAVAEATRLLKDAGFKICYHFMPNLPGSTPEHDVAMAKIMYTDPRFQPDFVKIYPAQVIEGTELYRQWERGEFVTYSDQIMLNTLKQIKLLTPPTVRIDRLVRDISKKWVKSGTKNTNMRQVLSDILKKEGKVCQCIRCREAKTRSLDLAPTLFSRQNHTLGGTDVMLSYEDRGSLYSLLRLRLPDQSTAPLFPELSQAGVVRELHTFGKVVGVGESGEGRSQHQGLGKGLLVEAEKLTLAAGYHKIAVIAAIGTRDYYRKFGYEREGLYMTKKLTPLQE